MSSNNTTSKLSDHQTQSSKKDKNHDIKKNLLKSLKERARSEKTDLKEIYDEEIKRFPKAAECVTVTETLRKMSNIRYESKLPTPYKTSVWNTLIKFNIDDVFYPKTPEDILLHRKGLVYNNQFNGIIFCNMKIIAILKLIEIRGPVVVIDEEFNQCLPECPTDLRQMFTVYVIYKKTIFPLVFVCLIERSRAAYKMVFEFILNLNLPCLNKRTVQLFTTFETNLQNAVNLYFPNWKQNVSSYHFNTTVSKDIPQLMNLALNDSKTRNMLQMLMVLPYLPTNITVKPMIQGFSIIEGFRALKILAIKRKIYYKMIGIFNYFENYWIKLVRPDRFSIHEYNLETNFLIEAYHLYLLDHLGVHTPVWTLYDRLRDVDVVTSLKINQLLSNSQKVKNKIQSIQRAYRSVYNGQTNIQFLEKVVLIHRCQNL